MALISNSILEQFQKVVGIQNVIHEPSLCDEYGHDKTEDLLFRPEVVLKPSTVEEVSAVMKLCSTQKIMVTPRGAGTGLSGGALPVTGGVVLSMEKFNSILSIDELNLQATVEPGVITEVFQQAVKEKGLFYPPDPASAGSCFIGGNVSTNSGGPKAIKYGVTRDYVLNLEVVLPSGEIIWTGANVLKYSTGYNLTHLLCGSEGTLGIITKIVFKLRGLPQHTILLMIPFATNSEACRGIAAIITAGITPSGLEFFEREGGVKAIDYCTHVLRSPIPIHLDPAMEAFVLCELDGNNQQQLMHEAERVVQIAENFKTGETLFADSHEQKEAIWKLRKNISPAVNWKTVTKSDDIVVPRSRLPELIEGIKKIGSTYGFNTVVFGHFGDGNIHVNILKEQQSDANWENEIPKAIGEMFQIAVTLGGTLSGEHGIGITKRPYMHLAMRDINLDIMRGIKKVFDPNGILNPGKIF